MRLCFEILLASLSRLAPGRNRSAAIKLRRGTAELADIFYLVPIRATLGTAVTLGEKQTSQITIIGIERPSRRADRRFSRLSAFRAARPKKKKEKRGRRRRRRRARYFLSAVRYTRVASAMTHAAQSSAQDLSRRNRRPRSALRRPRNPSPGLSRLHADITRRVSISERGVEKRRAVERTG
jgi:hypothetical protein